MLRADSQMIVKKTLIVDMFNMININIENKFN